jgi:ABC-type multidrug transport system ATPase subunit
MLKINHVQLYVGTRKPISFDLNPGEILWLRGGNGIGKTTLLKSILQQEKIASGEIIFEGSSMFLAKLAGSLTNFSYCPQHSEYFDDLRVERILELLSISSDTESLRSLKIHNFFNSLCSQLSQGEKQRLDIAIALSKNCKISILDEPFASQDSKWITKISELISEQAVIGKAFIIASHVELKLKSGILIKSVEID